MSTYVVTESSPSTSSYVRCGRGGFGNLFRASSLTTGTNTTSASSAAAKTSPARRYFSGVGGAGNAHSAAQFPSLADSLDDAVRHALARDNAAVGHCGRGGAGNIYHRRRDDAAASCSASVLSTASGADSIKSSMRSAARLWIHAGGAFGKSVKSLL